MTPDAIAPDLKVSLHRLRLGPLLDTLPERLALARQQKMPHQDFLLLILGDEVVRRDGKASIHRAQKAHLDPVMQLEAWDPTTRVTYDKELLNELAALRFIDAHAHVVIVGPVGVGKTFLAHALGHVACHHRYSVLALRADRMLKTLKHSRLDNSYETELRKLLAVDLLIIDDFALDAMDPTERRDIYEIMIERHRAGSMIVTSNRGPDEWLATFADPVPRPERHRPVHQHGPRADHRRGVLPAPPQAGTETRQRHWTERRKVGQPHDITTSEQGGHPFGKPGSLPCENRQPEHSIWESTYAYFDGPREFEVLARRMDATPELRVTLLLNIERKRGDTSGADQVVRRFADRFWGTAWPGTSRPGVYYDPRALELERPAGVLNAKAVVADDDAAFITSAHLTEAALDRNIEMGLLVRDRALAASGSSHFRGLIDRGLLVPLPTW